MTGTIERQQLRLEGVDAEAAVEVKLVIRGAVLVQNVAVPGNAHLISPGAPKSVILSGSYKRSHPRREGPHAPNFAIFVSSAHGP